MSIRVEIPDIYTGTIFTDAQDPTGMSREYFLGSILNSSEVNFDSAVDRIYYRSAHIATLDREAQVANLPGSYAHYTQTAPLMNLTATATYPRDQWGVDKPPLGLARNSQSGLWYLCLRSHGGGTVIGAEGINLTRLDKLIYPVDFGDVAKHDSITQEAINALFTRALLVDD